jgi:hypothetical protein
MSTHTVTYTVAKVGRPLLDVTGFNDPKPRFLLGSAIWVRALSEDGTTVDSYETTIDTQPRIGFTYTKVEDE